MLGIKAAVGRTLPPTGNVCRGGHLVAMLDYRYRESAFGGDPNVVGREMCVGDRTYTVIGLWPTDFPDIVRGLKAACPLTFLGMRVVLGAAEPLAAYLPVRRARRVNSVAALRID